MSSEFLCHEKLDLGSKFCILQNYKAAFLFEEPYFGLHIACTSVMLEVMLFQPLKLWICVKGR
jgi:hypothetical protein